MQFTVADGPWRAPALPAPFAGAPVLVVDDDPSVLSALAALLQDEYEVIVARSGQDALTLLQGDPPDLILLDVQMPGLTGFEVARQVLSKDMPVHLVFVTAFEQYAVQAFAQGALDYLVKPVQPPRLAETVSRLRERIDSAAPIHHSDDLLRELAKQRLPRGLFEFMDRGCEEEVSLRNNRAAFERIKLKPRVLNDVSKRDQSIRLFGHKQNMPIAIAPTGTPGIMWYEGELELARAAKKAGIPFTLATGSMTPMEKVAKEAGGELWFQLYMWPDRSLSHQLVERARLAGFKALIVTVDGVVSGNREFNLRNGFTVPFSFTRKNVTDVLMHPGWITGVLAKYMFTTGMPRYENYPSEIKYKVTAAPMGRSQMKNETLNWDDLRHLRKIWPHKLLVKGLLRAVSPIHRRSRLCVVVCLAKLSIRRQQCVKIRAASKPQLACKLVKFSAIG